jgi:hypothetical protein
MATNPQHKPLLGTQNQPDIDKITGEWKVVQKKLS